MLQLRYLSASHRYYTLLHSRLPLSKVTVHHASHSSCCTKFSQMNCHPVRCYVQTPPTTTPTNPSQLSIFQRAQQYIRDNPYTKFSLTLCVIVLGLSIAIELVKKYKKKKPPSIVGSLPTVGHYTIQRSSEVGDISRRLKSLDNNHRGVPLVFVTGPSGVGKTEVVSQYIKLYTASCTKWFGLKSVQPIVLFINGRNKSTFDLTLRDAAVSLGLNEADFDRAQQLPLLSQIHSRLVERKLPWLIVVDGLDDNLVSDFMSVVGDLPRPSSSPDWSSPTGGVVVTTTSTPQVPQENILTMKERLSSEDSLDLLIKLSKLDIDSEVGTLLVEELQGHPMSIALAANTIKIYQPYLECEADSASPAARYMDVLRHSITEGASLTDAILNLYIEAAITDQRFQHTFDLLGSYDLHYPIPLSLVGQHLTSSFYAITKEDLAPPAADQMARYRELTGLNQDDESLLGLVKALLPFLRKKPPSSEQLAEVLESADDTAYFIRECPLLAFKKFNSGFEYVEVHKLVKKLLPALFLKHTAPSMDKTRLVEEEARFERGAWFRQLRKFDPVKCLEKFHQTLPGISAPGVMTSDQFKKHPPIALNPSQSDSGSQFSTNDELSYSEYQHLISHHHRVVSTLHSELKSAGGEYRDIHLKQYLQPHFAALSRHPVISFPDSLLCEQALLSTEATTASIKPENYQEFVSRYKDIIAKQKRVFGSGSQVVARTMTDLADFKYSFRDVTGAHQLLVASLGILEKVQSRYADEEYKFDVGLTYTSLAYVYDDLGDKQKCKDLLERALAAYQTMPKDGQVSKRQRKLVASSLTNIAHAYLSLGDLVMAKKYIDLASVAHQNLYVDAHPESVRAMNISSNIYALLGDKSESIRLRTEAGKIKAKLDSKPLLV